MEMPLCPRGHGSVSIVFGGRYGVGKTRQLYKCVPADGSKPHRFVPVLPREPMSEHRCLECENPIHAHEGPKRARVFQWPLRTVVRTLGKVAAGATYVASSEDVRESSKRAGMLAADWVEAYTEDLWTQAGPKAWPQFLVTDAKAFHIRDWSARPDLTRKPRRGEKLPSKVAFTLLAVVGADPPPAATDHWNWKPVLAMVVPGGSVNTYDWCHLFSQLPGRPLGVTSDESNAFFNAVSLWWPDDPVTGEAHPQLSLCVYHAKQRFREHVAPASLLRPYGPTTQTAYDTLWPLWGALAEGPTEWDAFLKFARTLRWCAPIRAWLNRRVGGIPKHELFTDQLSRPFPHGPNSNSAAEAELRALTSRLGAKGRITSFRNAERTNRLLKLMVLERRGDYDERRWAEIIDRAFTARIGRPAEVLRTVSDRAGTSSLR